MTSAPPAQPRLLLLIASLFTGALIVSNIVAVKIADFSSVSGPIDEYFLPAAVIVFPISYIFGDVLTEVYGFRTARKVIWSAFLANGVAVLAIVLAGELTPAPFWQDQQAYDAILGQTWRIVGGSFTAFLVGEFANSIVLSRLKVATGGRFLWLRTISSTIVGEGLDSAIFITIAFAGREGIDLWPLIWKQWLFKVGFEVLATPVTYAVVAALKRVEGIDVYDRELDLNPVAVWE
ncbi:MAG TPA: queuosine precursor transporter [Tepidiformaceae bacterium]|nr:queuosine precursor transporter [Tepidiformaceae bacterium]